MKVRFGVVFVEVRGYRIVYIVYLGFWVVVGIISFGGSWYFRLVWVEKKE